MTYYTLTALGRTDPNPPKYKKVLRALLELDEESGVPYTAGQVSHLVGSDATEGLKYLKQSGYLKKALLPKPEAAARLRIPDIEKLAEAEIRRQISQQNYLYHSEKGKVALDKYWKGEKGVAVRQKYWRSEKGKVVQREYRQRRRQREIEEFKRKQDEERGGKIE